MKTQHFFQKVLCAVARAVPGLAFLLLAREAGANPTGMTVVSGSATAQTSGSQLNITTSQSTVLNWSTFNIAAGEQTVFHQPTATSVVYNRITDQNPSLIYGSLQANGVVVLLNSSGFYFGPNSYVSAAGLVVSTANCMPPVNSGGAWEFNGPPPLASIVNYGQIKIGNGGDCYFIANQMENHGTIEADGGNILFAAGQTVTMSERPDGRGMSMQVTLPQGSVDNYGNIIADGGTIALNAKVVNQNGLLQANSVRNENGVIELVAGDALNLGASSQISAVGDGSMAISAGGTVTLKSGNTFSDAVGSQIITTGGAQGGNGGDVEVSAPTIESLNSSMDAGAQNGFTGGHLLLDPNYIELASGQGSSGAVPGSGTVAYNILPGTLLLDVGPGGSFDNKNFSSITLQSKNDITLDSGTVWDLSGSTSNPNGTQVNLMAGGNIILNDGAQITDANNWGLTMQAGYSFVNNKVTPGTGSILLNGSSSIQLASGAINLTAGQDILVGADNPGQSGYIITTGGGSINVHALAGNIDTGDDAQGYHFVTAANNLASAYNLSDGLGGISTMAGGDVNLTAGGNVTSILQGLTGGQKGYYYQGGFVSGSGDYATAGAGAYGPEAGNVNIVAGGDVSGHYLVANGTGSIFAGVQMDANGNPIASGGKYVLGTTGNAGVNLAEHTGLALSLIKGGWNVTAGNNINLEEVRNPNGTFNSVGGSTVKHYYNYAPSDFVNLTAGNGIDLGGKTANFLRTDVAGSPSPQIIYPGILNILAGAGGVTFIGDTTAYRQLILFPSPLGSLVIDTTGGGTVAGQLPLLNGSPQVYSLIVSDSGSHQFTDVNTFGANDHAATPIHYGSEQPVDLNISGNLNLVSLFASEAAQINVVGDINNSRFQGMNLSGSDTTSIDVGQAAKANMEKNGVLNPATDDSLTVLGDILNTSAFTSINLNTIPGAMAPDLSVLARALGGLLTVGQLETSFYYDPNTKILTYQNIASKKFSDVLNFVQSLTVQKVDAQGNLLWLDPLHTIPDTEVVSLFNPTTANALKSAYAAPPVDQSGLAVGGGGEFDISARNVDLGTTAGITSKGVGLYNNVGVYPLANYFNTGANIVLDCTGDLTMFSTSIASFNGGNIYINADGNIFDGTSQFVVNTSSARGIFATGQGNVSVYAGGTIDVEGSRIAVYDTRPLLPGIPDPGGSLTVVSRNGDVVVGSGGSGYVIVNSFFVDPLTHTVVAQTPTIPGTGILATSFNRNGNVLVEALAGNVTIGVGGIKQVLFKGNNTSVNQEQVAALFSLALDQNYAGANLLENMINGIVTGAPASYVDVFAGYGLQQLNGAQQPILDAFGNPVISAANLTSGVLTKEADGENVTAAGSGIISAGNLTVQATGGIKGNFASTGGNVNLAAVNNISGNVFGAGLVSVSSDVGSISGTVIGLGGISASGGSIDANLESNGSISGGTSGGSGFAASATAGNVAAGANNDNNTQTAQKSTDNSTDDELNKKKKGIALAQKVSRVTVILPKKN